LRRNAREGLPGRPACREPAGRRKQRICGKAWNDPAARAETNETHAKKVATLAGAPRRQFPCRAGASESGQSVPAYRTAKNRAGWKKRKPEGSRLSRDYKPRPKTETRRPARTKTGRHQKRQGRCREKTRPGETREKPFTDGKTRKRAARAQHCRRMLQLGPTGG